MTYRAPDFAVQELVPEHVYDRFGESAYRFINPLLAITLQQLRNRHGRILINSYNRDRKQSGLRTAAFWEREYGYSPAKAQAAFDKYMGIHKFGGAADAIPLDTPLSEILEDIRQNPDLYPFLSFVEIDISWLHIDVRNQPDITFWSPKRGIVEVIKQTPFDWEAYVPGLATEKGE